MAKQKQKKEEKPYIKPLILKVREEMEKKKAKK